MSVNTTAGLHWRLFNKKETSANVGERRSHLKGQLVIKLQKNILKVPGLLHF